MSQVKQTLIKVFYLKCWNFFHNVILEIEKKILFGKQKMFQNLMKKKFQHFLQSKDTIPSLVKRSFSFRYLSARTMIND